MEDSINLNVDNKFYVVEQQYLKLNKELKIPENRLLKLERDATRKKCYHIRSSGNRTQLLGIRRYSRKHF